MYFYYPTITTAANNGTDQPSSLAGFIAAGIAVLFYGSNYVPVKQFDSQDGMTYQLFLCIGIWLTGMVVNAIRNFPQFQPFVMIGGALWATGNLCVVPIIQTIGIGLGILIWGTINMLSGWASGRFGWFDIPPQVPHRVILNYIGVSLSVVSAAVIFFITPETAAPPVDIEDEARRSLLSSIHVANSTDQHRSISIFDDTLASVNAISNDAAASQDNYTQGQSVSDTSATAAAAVVRRGPFWIRVSPNARKAIGVSLAILIGPTYGLAFVPTYYVQSHVPDASTSGLDYVFSHFTGILCASMLYFCVYAAAMRNRPAVNPRVILPAVVSGAMWGIATASWFLANQVLSESVAFPIITTAPAVVAALWGVCVFKEIKGARNLMILAMTFATTTTGSILNGMSR